MSLIVDSMMASDRAGVYDPVRLPPALEAEFRVHDGEKRRRQAVWGMALGLVCYLGLLGIDWLLVPDVARFDAIVRIAIGLPVGVLALAVLGRPGLPSIVYQGVVAVYGLTCAATVGVVMARSADPAGLSYFCAGLVVMTFTINLVGMNPPMAAATCAAVTVLTAALASTSPFGSTGVIVTHLVFGAMVSVVATFANWCLLNQRRHGFLMSVRSAQQLRQIAGQRDLLERLATVDALTDLPNRRGFDAMVSGDLAAAAEGTPVLVAMIDVDCFKAFNDGYGHPAGDAVLRVVADALSGACDPGTRIGRLGGEEFGMVLVGAAGGNGQAVGDRLCRAVEDAAVPHRWSDAASVVTVSVGLANGVVGKDQRDCASLFPLADRALYDAKRAGRGRAIVAEGRDRRRQRPDRRQPALSDTTAESSPAPR